MPSDYGHWGGPQTLIYYLRVVKTLIQWCSPIGIPVGEQCIPFPNSSMRDRECGGKWVMLNPNTPANNIISKIRIITLPPHVYFVFSLSHSTWTCATSLLTPPNLNLMQGQLLPQIFDPEFSVSYLILFLSFLSYCICN